MLIKTLPEPKFRDSNCFDSIIVVKVSDKKAFFVVEGCQ